MKTIKIRALYFKAVKPTVKTIEVSEELFDQIPDSISETHLAQLMGLRTGTTYVRRFQIQHNDVLIYSSPNRSDIAYSCDSEPW